MEQTPEDDPFLWSTERLLRELCTDDRTWDAPIASRLPPADALAARLIQLELDGESLLTYEDTVGSFAPLLDQLQVAKIPQQLALVRAVRLFQARSKAYHRWRKEQGFSVKEDAPLRDTVKQERPSPLAHVPNGARRHSLPASAGSDPVEPEQQALPSSGPEGQGESPPGDLATPVARNGDSGESRPVQESPMPSVAADLPPPPGQATPEGPPKKKVKRIAPVTLDVAPTRSSASRHLPTEADIFAPLMPSSPVDASGFVCQDTLQFAYLGKGSLTPYDLLAPDMSSTTDPSRGLLWVKPGRLPPGRQLQVNRFVRRYLRRKGPGAAKSAAGVEQDEVLPIFGESDEEYDSETWEEIQKETAERERQSGESTVHHQLLSHDEVNAVIDEAIRKMEDTWTESKKPALDRKAYRIWNRHRRSGTRKVLIKLASTRLQQLDARISAMCANIRASEWKNREELGQQMTSLQLSIHDRQYERWLIKLLSSPAPPPKPYMLPRKDTRPRRLAPPLPSGEEEILTSDSDHDLHDFVDESDEGDPMEMDSRDGDQTDLADVPNSRPVERRRSPESGDSSTSEDVDYDLTQVEDSVVGADDPYTRHVPSADVKDSCKLEPASVEPVSEQLHNTLPHLQDPESLAKLGLEHWESFAESKCMVVVILYNWDGARRNTVFDYVQMDDWEDVWNTHVVRVMERIESSEHEDRSTMEESLKSADLVRLFHVYTTCSVQSVLWHDGFRRDAFEHIRRQKSSFAEFYGFLRALEPKLRVFPAEGDLAKPASGPVREKESPAEAKDVDEAGDDLRSASSSGDDLPLSPTARRRPRKILRNRAAEDLRETNRRLREEHEERRRMLRRKLALSAPELQDQARFIINEAKEDDQGFIYVHPHIASRIKPHQVAGVRFMWDQIVAQSHARQGCLLAHTMGLGKTMQVITLLVAIAEASQSDDLSVSSQIPDELKESKTLILCPAGLVDNWMDELLMWTPPDESRETILGALFSIGSSLTEYQRHYTVKKWARKGGILVIGYTMFAKVWSSDAETARLLTETPNIVVGDEAHILKNQKSQIHRMTGDFRTKTRIAMTGSPLANNVQDYYSMIDWVAPNYLATPSEFEAVYAKPIKDGLYADSSPAQKRRALKMLNVLKETVAPKVHRMSIAALKSELPVKKEFILYLRLTDMQMAAYQAYTDHVRNSDSLRGGMMTMSRIWSYVSVLSTLTAHPRIFRERLQAKKLRDEAEMSTPAGPTANREPENRGSPPAAGSPGGDSPREGTPGAELPETLVSDVLATVSTRNIEDYTLSWKIVVLTRILDEAKKVGDKVLVFTQLIPTLDYLQEMCRRQKRNFSRLDGKTPVSERQRAIKTFNRDDSAEVYLISTRAGGVGLNIYGANRVVIFDFKYVPTEEQQAVGRAYRLGQTKPVFVYWLIAGGTFETTIQNRSVFKAQLSSRVVDKKNPIAWSKRHGDYFADPTIPPKSKSLDAFLGKDQILDALLTSDDTAEGIRSVLMTDTFEEEEPDDHILTSEDRKEVSDRVAENKLRLQQPAASSSSNVAPTAGRSRPGPAGQSGNSGVALEPSSGQRDSSLPSPSPLLANSILSHSIYFQPPTPSSTQPQRPTSPPTLSPLRPQQVKPLGGLEPVLGTGTQIRDSRNSASHPLPRTHRTAAVSGSARATSLDAKKAAFVDVLHRRHVQLVGERGLRSTLIDPGRIASEIEEALVGIHGPAQSLERLDRWNHMLKVAGHAQTADALLTGQLDPRKLAAMKRAEVEDLLAGRHKESPGPGSRQTHGPFDTGLRPRLSTTGRADMEAVQEFFQDRPPFRPASDRHPRLPPWAQMTLSQETDRQRREAQSPAPTAGRPGESIDSPFVID